MGTYVDLKTAIDSVVRTNGNNEITGAWLQHVLLSMVNSLGANATFAGIATPETIPGTPDQRIFYIAYTPGTYSNMGGFTLGKAQIALITYLNIWEHFIIDLGTYTEESVFGDFNISDEQGNVVLRIANGHIETKNFNSAVTASTTETGLMSALDKLKLNSIEDGAQVNQIQTTDNPETGINFMDERNHVVLRIANGHIRTKNFNSAKIGGLPLEGKTYSILGDSISTFKGCLKSDDHNYTGAAYAYFYPKEYMNDVNKTWWRRMEALTGLSLLCNCAWSGSQTCGNSLATNTAAAGCSTRRVTDLSKDGIAPDIIIIFIGVNDLRDSNSRQLGTWDGNSEIPAESNNVNKFSDAYALMVKKVMANYPLSEIYCCTILESNNASWDIEKPLEYPCKNSRGNTTDDWNTTIKMVADSLGAKIIDMHACGINFFNITTFTGDRLHPNTRGAALMAKQAARDLISQSNLTLKY